MPITIQDFIKQNKDCPKEKEYLLIQIIRDYLNKLNDEEFKQFCLLDKSEINRLVTAFIIQKVYDYPKLPDIDDIEFVNLHTIKHID